MFGRTLDRRVAWCVFGLAAVVLAAVAARNEAAVPAQARNDTAAMLRMLALMRAGERVDAIVDYAVTRTVPGVPGEYTASTTDAQWGDAQLTRGPDTLLIDLPDRAYDCERVRDVARCAPKAPDRSLPPSQVFEVAVAVGAYDVTPLPPKAIAGEHAQCFRVAARTPGHVIAGIDEETDQCLAADGVVLSTRRVAADATQARVARRVERTVDRATLAGLFSGFDAAFALLHR